MAKILFITDKYKVSQGYEPAFTRLLNKAGLNRHDVMTADIYGLVESPIRKYGNETTWKFNDAKTREIEEAFASRVSILKPSVIVVADPACAGIFANWNKKLASVDKMRGGVYSYKGIPVVITYPITALHQRIDQRIVQNEDGEQDTQEPYKVQHGAWVLANDWQKISRVFHGKTRKLPPFRYSVVRTLQDAIHARNFLMGCVFISADVETGCFPPQRTCDGFTGLTADGRVHSYVFPWYDEFKPDGVFWESAADHIAVWTLVRDILASPILKVMQNGNYDSSYFIRDRTPIKGYLVDLMYLWYSRYPELPKSLDFICSILLDNYQYWKDDIKGVENESAGTQRGDMELYWRYNALDCYNTLFGATFMLLLLGVESNAAMRYNYNDVFLRGMSGLKMSMRGVRADFDRREKHRADLTLDRADALDKFRYMIDDPEFNVESPAQKVALLYDFLGVRPRNKRGRYTTRDGVKDNAPSSSALAMKLAKTDHPFFRLIIEAMEQAMVPAKQIANICNFFLATDRMRCSFAAAGTETGRFSTKSSNFWDGSTTQNWRKQYRDWLVADPHNIFIDIDYSQSDDVFMAYESQDPEKIAVVESGRDAHAVNGELFFKREYDWIVAGKKAGDPLVIDPLTGVRQLSKRIVHGTNFQMAAMTLYVTMGREAVVAAALLLGYKDAESWPQERLVQLCGMLMGSYRGRYKRLTPKEYYAELAKQLREKGALTNAYGLTRTFLGDPRDNGTQREGTAFIGQSDTASNMNRVMYEIDHGFIQREFRDGPNPDYGDTPRMMSYESHGFRFHLQVHDNFVAQLDTRNPRWKEAAHNLLHVMNRPVIIHGREVRIRAEAELGIRWSGKEYLAWDGKDDAALDRIAATLLQKQREGVY